MGIEKYSTTPASNNAASPDGFPENMRPSQVNDSARAVMADSPNGFSISYVSATVFKFPNTDRRTLVPVNRRIKAGVGAGTIYGTCTDSSLSASDTQITVSWDSGTLDTSLSYISLGILSPTNNSFPRNLDQSFSDISVSGQASFSDVHISSRLNSTYAARAWGYVTNAAGTPALAASVGVSGISDVGQGLVQIKLSISMTSSDYSILALQDSGNAPRVSARSKTEFTVNTRDISLSATDCHFNFAVFGVQ
jgi:hypothetical protein